VALVNFGIIGSDATIKIQHFRALTGLSPLQYQKHCVWVGDPAVTRAGVAARVDLSAGGWWLPAARPALGGQKQQKRSFGSRPSVTGVAIVGRR
jgi:hypothetical protein